MEYPKTAFFTWPDETKPNEYFVDAEQGKSYTRTDITEALARALEYYINYNDWEEYESDTMASVYDRQGGSKLGDDKGETARKVLEEYRK